MENKLIFAKIATSQVTTKVIDGRSYLVAPVVAIRAGVLNAELVPADEIQKSVKLWNDVPIPIDHPLRGDEKISARDIEVIEKVVVGRFYNAYYDDEKLKGELWIDIEKAKKVGGDALKALEKLQNGEPLEVSTSYFTDVSDETGTYNGEEYDGIQYNLRPDHLALLPTGIGACSWQDGCGAPRVNQEGDPMPQLRVALREGESYEMRREAVEKAVKAAVIPDGASDWYVYIYDLFEDSVVYQVTKPDQESGYAKAPYTINDNLEATLGAAAQVKRKVEYTTLESYEDLVVNPYPNEHSCRLVTPGKFQKEHWSRGTREHDGKKYSVIRGRLKGETTTTEQAFRYPTDIWTKSAAKSHCTAHDGILFEPASGKGVGHMETEPQEGFIEKVVGPLREFVRNLIEVRNMSEKEEMLETLHKNGVELEGLEDLGESTLKWMVEHSVEPNPAPDPNPDPTPNPDPDPNPDLKVQKNEELDTRIEERLKARYEDFDKIKAHMQEVAEEADTAKKKLVDALVANEKCTVSKEALEKIETDVLRQFAAQFEPGSYLGVGVPHRDLEAIPAPPAVVLATNKEGDK